MSKKKEYELITTSITFKAKGVKPIIIEIKGIDENHRLILDIKGTEALEKDNVPEFHASVVAVIAKILINMEVVRPTETTEATEATMLEEYIKVVKKNGYKIGEA
jgi:hypothetical protein